MLHCKTNIIIIKYYFDLTIFFSCSVSLLLTTTEAAVVDNPHDKNKPPSRVPDMDDLDL